MTLLLVVALPTLVPLLRLFADHNCPTEVAWLASAVIAQGGDERGNPMGLIPAFHTSSTEDGDNLVYHNQSECGYAKEIIRNGNVVPGLRNGTELCEKCDELG